MSVIVVGKMKTDPANIKKLWANRTADFEAVANEARAAGALHHRWGFGDGFITIIDEWPDAATFESFFSGNTRIPSLMQEGGVQGPPEFTIVEAVEGPDQF